MPKGHGGGGRVKKKKKKVIIVPNPGEIRPIAGGGCEFSSHACMCIHTLWGWELAAGWRRKEKVIFKYIY